jgi:hypothetical protein
MRARQWISRQENLRQTLNGRIGNGGRGVAQMYRCWLFLTVLSSSALVSLSGRLLAQQLSAQFSPSY